jgi:FMN phosphatase YigB (HAD superfamily)
MLDWNVSNIVRSVDVPIAQQLEIKRELFDHQDWLDLDCGLVTEEEVVARICNRTSLTTPALVKALSSAKESLIPISNSLNILLDINKAGLPLYCLSNMSVETFGYLKSKMDFFECFDGIIISGIEKCMKPDRKIFEVMLERHDLDASSSLFIDDSAANIATARTLGMQTHQFKRTNECYSRIRELLL